MYGYSHGSWLCVREREDQLRVDDDDDERCGLENEMVMRWIDRGWP